MSAAFRRLGPSELLPRYIFIERLFVRRRVLEVGAVASTSGESARFLLQRGAREVVACDDDVAAVEEAQRRLGQEHLRYRAAVFEDLEVGGFDLVLVADLAPYVRAPLLLDELVRRVARGGWLVGALRNPAGLALSQVMEPEQGDPPPTYGQLLDALTPHLPRIEVATQSPLLGYQLAFDTAEGLEVDGTLGGQGEAAWFIVFAGSEPLRTFEPTWVQLPPEPLAFTSGKLDEAAERLRAWEERGHKLKAALEKARAEVDAGKAEMARLAAALESAREEGARLIVQLESRRETAQERRHRDELATRLKRTECELQLAHQRTQDAERRLEESTAAAGTVELERQDALAQVASLRDELRLERARREEQQAQLEETLARLKPVGVEERGRLEDEARSAAAALQAVETELAGVQQAMAAAEARTTEAEAAVRGELATALREKDEAAASAQEARAQEAIVREWLESAQAAGREAREQMEEERREAAALGDQLAALQASEARLREEVEAKHRAEAALSDQLATARASEATLRGEVAALAAQLANVQASDAALREERDAQLDALAKVNEQLRTAQASDAALREEHDAQLDALAKVTEQLRVAQASDAMLREERAAQLDAAAKLNEQIGAAQATEAMLREELQAARGDAESARRTAHALDEKLKDLSDQVEQATRRESGLSQQVTERDAQLELLRRQIDAQEIEILSLRRAVGRSATTQVQQIYERATAELQSVKADLLKRTTSAVGPPKAYVPSGTAASSVAAAAKSAASPSGAPSQGTSTSAEPLPGRPIGTPPPTSIEEGTSEDEKFTALALDEDVLEELDLESPPPLPKRR